VRACDSPGILKNSFGRSRRPEKPKSTNCRERKDNCIFKEIFLPKLPKNEAHLAEQRYAKRVVKVLDGHERTTILIKKTRQRSEQTRELVNQTISSHESFAAVL